MIQQQEIIQQIIELDNCLDSLFLLCTEAKTDPLLTSFVYQVCRVMDDWKENNDFDEVIERLTDSI